MAKPATIIEAVCDDFAITAAQLADTKDKGGDSTRAREVCCCLVTRAMLDDTRLAQLIGVHRTAVLKLRRAGEARMKTDRAFARRVGRIARAAGLGKKKAGAGA